MKFTLLICSYNPNPVAFRRCLNAVATMQANTPFPSEVIVVDNNSIPPLAQNESLQEFLAGGPNRVHLSEPRPGKTNALLLGFEMAKGEAIIINDDDNLPSADYLVKAEILLRTTPWVGVWGPGIVDVIWEDGVTEWAKGWGSVFLAKHRTHAEYGCLVGWPSFFPAGAGTVITRAVFEKYVNDVRSGRLTALCRCGGKMTSAGDAQIVWTAVRMGLCAGTSPQLKLGHFTARGKATLGYVCRVTFGCMASGPAALVESFPEEAEGIRKQLTSAPTLYWRIFAELAKLILLLRIRSGPVTLARFLGELYGQHIAVGRRPLYPLRMAARILGYV